MKKGVINPIILLERRIYFLRKTKVMIDRDLANLYGMTTSALIQAMKRNIERFPIDFMFQLTKEEKGEVITVCDDLRDLKYSSTLPHVFTEHGVAMLSSVLRSKRAVQMNIFIIRAFVKIRELLATNKDIAHKLEELERRQSAHDNNLAEIYTILKQLIDEPIKKTGEIGFDLNNM